MPGQINTFTALAFILVSINELFVNGHHLNFTRHICQKPVLYNESESENCQLEQFWIRDYRQVDDIIQPYSGYKNVWIIAVPLNRGQGLMQVIKGQFPNEKEEQIAYSQLLSGAVSISMELVAGAVPFAIRDFCRTKTQLNYTFV